MTIKELIFGTNDATHKVKTYPAFGDYEFKTDNKSLKEFEEELGIERKHNRLPWEVNLWDLSNGRVHLARDARTEK